MKRTKEGTEIYNKVGRDVWLSALGFVIVIIVFEFLL